MDAAVDTEDWVTTVTEGFVAGVGKEEGRDVAKDEGSKCDEEEGSDADDDEGTEVTAPDKEAKAAAALIDDEAGANAELAMEDAKERLGNKLLPPVEQMGLLLTRPDVALAPVDWTRPSTLLANLGPVLRLVADPDEDDVVELATDVREKREEEVRAVEGVMFCEVESGEARSSVREEAVVDGLVIAVVVWGAAGAAGIVVVNVCVVAAGGLDKESGTEEKAWHIF